jgi:hypothetical protein
LLELHGALVLLHGSIASIKCGQKQNRPISTLREIGRW